MQYENEKKNKKTADLGISSLWKVLPFWLESFRAVRRVAAPRRHGKQKGTETRTENLLFRLHFSCERPITLSYLAAPDWYWRKDKGRK